MDNSKIHWYVVKTRPRWEKKIVLKLNEKGIENYCPLQKRISQWSDRKKVIIEPVFKGYIFVRIDDDKIWEVKKVDGIINYIYWLGKPAIMRNEDLSTIKKFLNEFETVEVEKYPIQVRSKVRITQGALMNYEGVLVELSGNKAIVRIESMGIFLSAHFDKNMLESINLGS